MAFAKPEYTRQEVNAAGKALRAAREENAEAWTSEQWIAYMHTIDVIGNWRSAHGYPLNTFAVTLRNCARRIDNQALIAQRTKRLASISAKLAVRPQMKLTQMQDIGGCRAVLGSVKAVRELQHYYEEEIDFDHERAAKDDYISAPRPSGYRGVHLIYKYRSDRASTSVYNDLKIEIQIRSLYQHAWATSVETVGMFTRQALKSSQGESDWLRFFQLMGTVIALRERCPPVPGTPIKRSEIRDELADRARKLGVSNRLRGYSVAVSQMRKRARANDRYFLLELDAENETLKISGFPAAELELAQKRYSDAEKQVQDHVGRDAVLVSVDSLAALEKAYPNYFADTRVFTQLMHQVISGRSRGVTVPPLKLETAAHTSKG